MRKAITLKVRSAKGAAARHHERMSTPQPFRWPLDTATVLRVFLGSAKAAARSQTRRNSRRHSGGALDTAPVLRVFLGSAKGAPAPRNKVRNSRGLDAPVLRVFLGRTQ